MDLMPVHDSDTLGPLHFDSVLPVQSAPIAHFASGVYPAKRACALRGPGDSGSGPAAGDWAARMGLELPRTVDTVYLGGGTPSLLAPALLTQLFAAIRLMRSSIWSRMRRSPWICAPGQIPARRSHDAAIGVNRVSMGVQSFIDREAQVSGRLHNRAVVEEDVRRLRAAGFQPESGSDCRAGRADAGLVGRVADGADESGACRTPASTCWRWN